MIEVGRVCIKTAGREAGRVCIVVKKMKDDFFMVTGPRNLTGVRRRKCNAAHLEPVDEKLDIKADAPDETVAGAFEKADLFSKMKVKKLSKAELKKLEARKAAKAEKKAKTKPREKPKETPKKEGKKKKGKPKKEEGKETKKEAGLTPEEEFELAEKEAKEKKGGK